MAHGSSGRRPDRGSTGRVLIVALAIVSGLAGAAFPDMVLASRERAILGSGVTPGGTTWVVSVYRSAHGKLCITERESNLYGRSRSGCMSRRPACGKVGLTTFGFMQPVPTEESARSTGESTISGPVLPAAAGVSVFIRSAAGHQARSATILSLSEEAARALDTRVFAWWFVALSPSSPQPHISARATRTDGSSYTRRAVFDAGSLGCR